MAKPLFSKKIKCYHCGGNYKAKLERGKRVYICSRYDNYGKDKCVRIPIREERILRIIQRRYDEQLKNEEVAKLVEQITVEDKYLFKIELKNDKPIIYGRNFIQF